MSEQHSITIPAHHNIYTGSSNRELRIEFSTPQNCVNERTGLVIFVPGFGGHIDSKVYKKMRQVFADKYNLVTIQSNYFGSSYMQSSDRFTVNNNELLRRTFSTEEMDKINEGSFFNILAEKYITLPVVAILDENIEEFNDMSYMQAIDIISTLEAIKILLNENNIKYDSNRVIGYGHSHGAYLLHLCNRLAPNLFSYIIDNSAWIEPLYLTRNRFLTQGIGNSFLAIEFDYLAKKIISNKKDLHLEMLYKDYDGKTQILAFQGDHDVLVNHIVKKQFIESIVNSDFILVKKEDVDNVKYNSNGHGLNADFLELFSYSLEFEHKPNENLSKDLKYKVNFERGIIDVDFSYGLPVFNLILK